MKKPKTKSDLVVSEMMAEYKFDYKKSKSNRYSKKRSKVTVTSIEN